MIRPVRKISIFLALISLVLFSGIAACDATDTPTSITDSSTDTTDSSTTDNQEAAAEPTPTDEPEPEPEPTATQAAEEPTPTAVAEEAAPAEPTATPTEEPAPAAEPVIFQINAEQSEARFIIDELLFGNPKTVVGRTSDVSGEISINLADISQTQIGVIQVNARDLTTDDSFRNRALRNRILDSSEDEYQYIIFTPTAIDGLPASAAPGDSFTIQVTGDLQIRDIVSSETFEVSITADSESQVSGIGTAIVLRETYDLNIPRVPGVANVAEEVGLEIEFVAISSE